MESAAPGQAAQSVEILKKLGKFSPSFMEEVVYSNLGVNRSEVLVGPGFGIDNAIVEFSKGTVLAVTTDPISLIPQLGVEDSAWLSVHHLASDLATSGFPPAYALVEFNLPPVMSDDEFARYWDAMVKELGRMGVMVIGGHTGRFEGCDFTIIGGATLFAVGPKNTFLSSHMAKPGNKLLLTKTAALSSAAILSRVFPRTVESTFGGRFLRKVSRLLRSASTVKDALTAASLGVRQYGITAMHDAAEGGVHAALYEMLMASKVGAIIDEEATPVSEEVQAICDLFSMDPYTSLAEGCLVLAATENSVNALIDTLKKSGIPCIEVGKVVDRKQGIRIRKDGRQTSLKYPKSDPYWGAYWKAEKRDWR